MLTCLWKLQEPVGQGNFGIVFKEELSSVVENEESTMTIAVKMLKNSINDSDMADLVSEMEVMKRIGKHLNIINLIGCCTQNGDYLLHNDLLSTSYIIFKCKDELRFPFSPRVKNHKSYINDGGNQQLTIANHYISFWPFATKK